MTVTGVYRGSSNILSTENIYKDETSFPLCRCVDALHNLARTESVILLGDDNIKLIVQVAQAEIGGVHVPCQYYFIDYPNRTVIWLHDHIQLKSDIVVGLRGIYDPSHVGASCRTYDVN
jgi:hypothetical protein